MHKIIVKDEVILLEKDNILDIKENSNIVIYLKGSGNVDINIKENCNVTINHLGVDLSNKITINLNEEYSKIQYNYSVINYKNNSLKMIINHNSSNTESNVYSHGVNVKKEILAFDITGNVEKNTKKCICNQENRIINMEDGKSTIKPNLIIDSFDTTSSHSAYIGKFNDNIIFYLMSRGISVKKAFELLISSFLIPGDIDKDKIEEFVKELGKI